jgi:hypothetical protein
MNQVTKKGDLRKQHVVSSTGDAVYLNGCLIGVYGAQHAAEKIANRLRVALGYPSSLPTDADDEAIVDERVIRADERERCAKECGRLARIEWSANCTSAANAYKYAADCIRRLR